MKQTLRRLTEKAKRRSILVAAAAALGVIGVAETAYATHSDGKVTVVEYVGGTQPFLLVQLGNTYNFYAYLNSPSGCAAHNQAPDTIKAWQSLAQAAVLSGRSVRVHWTLCNGAGYIWALDLNSQ